MDCEHKLKALEQEIESLKEENRLLKEKLSSSEKNFDSVSFKEKYAVRILDSLPDMLTVFNHEETGIEVVSNEETNHVGVPNSAFAGMHMWPSGSRWTPATSPIPALASTTPLSTLT